MRYVHDKLMIEHLRQLQAGAAPDRLHCGICHSVYVYVERNGGLPTYNKLGLAEAIYDRMGEAFKAFGLDDTYPLGLSGGVTGMWQGANLIRRRALAGQVADWLEAQQ